MDLSIKHFGFFWLFCCLFYKAGGKPEAPRVLWAFSKLSFFSLFFLCVFFFGSVKLCIKLYLVVADEGANHTNETWQLQAALVGDITNIDLNLVLTGIACYSYAKYGYATCSLHKLEYQWMWESC